MQVYRRDDFNYQIKSDNSPVTEADLAAHKVIAAGLNSLTPELPLMSEEGSLPSLEQRKTWQQYWCVDPLDGTKEFIQRNDEFTINIALIEQHHAVLGIIMLPVSGTLYWGSKNIGAWKKEKDKPAEKIHCRRLAQEEITLTVSRRHGQGRNEIVTQQLQQNFAKISHLQAGSSLKFCLIAEGAADFYPRLFPTCEWDTAAAQAILEAAGGGLVEAKSGDQLHYNRKDSILNPFFYAFGDPQFPLELLAGITEE